MKKRCLSVLLALCMLLTFLPASALADENFISDEEGDEDVAELMTASSTVQITSYGQVVDTFNGVPARYIPGKGNSDTGEYSCAGYVKAYYSAIYNVSVSNLLKGRTPIASNGRFSVTSSPEPGDVGYQLNSSGTGGHWFIIKEVNGGGSYTIIEQNWKSTANGVTTCRINRQVSYGGTSGFQVFRWSGKSSSNNSTNNSVSPTPVTHDPQILLDAASSPSAGQLYVKGWAYDPDNKGKSLEIHIYAGDEGKCGLHIATVTANKSRPDVNDVFPGVGTSHGFEETLSVSINGSYSIRAAAIGINSAGNHDNNNMFSNYIGVNISQSKEQEAISGGGSNPAPAPAPVPDPAPTNNDLLDPVIYNRGFYLAAHPDLQAAFWDNDGALQNHWLNAGIHEGRQASQCFCASWYVGVYPDLAAAFGNNYVAAASHFLHNGIPEGRAGSEHFNLGDYKANYGDLQSAFGDNNYQYAAHYINHGWDEQRIANRRIVVRFDATGGSCSLTEQPFTQYRAYGSLPTPSRAGYIFDGWFTGDGTPVSSDTVAPYPNDHTLYARWSAKTFNVTLNANGGDVSLGNISVRYGETYGALPTPVRDGYTFEGWHTASSGGSKITAGSAAPNGNCTLYAHWTRNSYTITLDANGGSVSPGSVAIAYGEPYSGLPTPIRKGYLFEGWHTGKIGGVKINESAGSVLSDQTLYALWTLDDGSEFLTGGGTETNPYQIFNQKDLLAVKRNLSAHYLLKSDIALTGLWTPIGLNTDFDGVFDGGGHTISNLSVAYSDWTYAGLFGSNAGTIRNLTVIGTVSGGNDASSCAGILAGRNNFGTILNCSVTGTVTVSKNTAAGGLAGYFRGGSASGCASSAAVNVSGYGIIGGLFSVADNSSNIANCYALGGVQAANATADSIAGGLVGHLAYNSKVTNCYAAGAVSADGGKYGGLIGFHEGIATACYFDMDTSGQISANAGTPLSGTLMKTRSVYSDWDFNAVWDMQSGVNNGYPYLRGVSPIEEKKQCVITFDANGGTVTPSSVTVTLGEAYGNLPAPVRENYTFDGWHTAKSGGNQITEVSAVTATADHTLYAHWTEIPPPKSLVSIEIVSKPDKVSYEIGEAWNSVGLVVHAIYHDNTREILTDGFSVNGFNSSSAGMKTITVTYQGKSAAFNVTVKEAVSVDSNAARIVIENQTASPGSAVTIPVLLKGNPGVIGFSFALEYDTEKLEYVSATDADFIGMSSNISINGNQLGFAYSSASNANLTGEVIAKLNFRVKSGAQGTANLSFILDETFHDGFSAFNPQTQSNEPVKVSAQNGAISIADFKPGDIDGNGRVDNEDLILLTRYRARWKVTINMDAADVDGNGRVDNEDLILLTRYRARWKVTLLPGKVSSGKT